MSAGLDLDGGGRALAGRLLAAGCAAFAAERGIEWRLLSLSGLDGFEADPRARGFAGRRQALALAAWRGQLGGRAACVYDLLGPARVQLLLPPPLGAPYLVTIYGIEVWRRLGLARRRALSGASARMAISRHTRDRAEAANGAIGPVDVVPLCLEERPPAGEVDGALLERAGSGYLLIVGRMAASERYKGHEALFAALAQLEAARLVVAGDGDDRERLAARAQALGLGERVLFTGFVSEATLAELYARAAVFVMPSLGEGFGLVYLEAMRAGKPCVAARDSAAAEIVADGETGLLVDPRSQAEIAAAVARLLADPALARAMGEAGRRRFHEAFAARHFRARLWPLLDRLVGGDS